MMRITSSRYLWVLLVLTAAGCAGDRWPDPPAVEQAAYQQEHAAWQQEQRQTISESLPLVGIWTIAEGDTPFGADASLPVALPASAGTARGGVLRRTGDTIAVVPAAGVAMRRADGSTLTEPTEFLDPVRLGAIELFFAGAGADGSLFVMASDLNHPAAKTPPPADVFALDANWRVSARFDAFASPRMMKIADVRGGMSDMPAVGELVFPLAGRERRLVVFEGGEDHFFLMFKDATNGSTTYGGYRILKPKAVRPGEFTVIDFNFAYNPPCAYSSFTTCPLPPRENTLDVAVEAGLKQLPSVKGWQG